MIRRAPRSLSPGVGTVNSWYQPRGCWGSSRSTLPKTIPSREYGYGPPRAMSVSVRRASTGNADAATTRRPSAPGATPVPPDVGDPAGPPVPDDPGAPAVPGSAGAGAPG